MIVRHAGLADYPQPRRRSPLIRHKWLFIAAWVVAALGPWAMIAAIVRLAR